MAAAFSSLDDLLERFQHFYLGGHVQRRGGLIQHQQVRFAAQRHGRHQPLQLPTGHLVRVAIPDAIRDRVIPARGTTLQPAW